MAAVAAVAAVAALISRGSFKQPWQPWQFQKALALAAVAAAMLRQLGWEILAKKNSEIIQESSRTFLSHSEEDYLRRERKIIYEDSGVSCQ